MIIKYLDNLMLTLEDEFETHAVTFDWFFKKNTGHLIIKVNYPLSNDWLVMEASLPKTGLKKIFEFIKMDFIDRVYDYINEKSQKYGYSNAQQRKED